MSKDFLNLEDAGHQLAEIVDAKPVAVIALVGQGAEIAIALARKFEVPVIPSVITRDSVTNEVIGVAIPAATQSGLVYMVDDAVETGHTTRVAFTAATQAGFTDIRVAVPVCPRDTGSELFPITGDIIAVKRPMVRRSLSWHYVETPSTTQEAALSLISQHNLMLSQ